MQAARFINTNLNAPAVTNGVPFELVNGKMVSVDLVDGENYEIFSAVPGFIALGDTKDQDQAAPAPAPVAEPVAEAVTEPAAADADEPAAKAAIKGKNAK